MKFKCSNNKLNLLINEKLDEIHKLINEFGTPCRWCEYNNSDICNSCVFNGVNNKYSNMENDDD